MIATAFHQQTATIREYVGLTRPGSRINSLRGASKLNSGVANSVLQSDSAILLPRSAMQCNLLQSILSPTD